MDELRNQLRARRVSAGLSQQELAASARVARQTIGGIEGGLYSPSASVALRLARALSCRVEDLFWLDADGPPVMADPSSGFPPGCDVRVALTQIGGRWRAHALAGDDAFRAEMIPSDGIARLEAESGRARVKLTDDPESVARSVMLAGCTPALSLWARAAERSHPGLRVHWAFRNSAAALSLLAAGEIHGAGLHLGEPGTEECNAPYVRTAMPGQTVTLVQLGVWDEGLAVAHGNPRGIRGAADLAQKNVTIVNREPGAGARLLLESALNEAGVPFTEVRGWGRLARGHQEVAREVATGAADAGTTSAAVAAAYGLAFVPLRAVRYELALRTESLDYAPVRQLLATLEHRWVRSQLAHLVGYDTSGTGQLRTAA